MHCAVVSMGQYNGVFDNFDPNKKHIIVSTQAQGLYSEPWLLHSPSRGNEVRKRGMLLHTAHTHVMPEYIIFQYLRCWQVVSNFLRVMQASWQGVRKSQTHSLQSSPPNMAVK